MGIKETCRFCSIMQGEYKYPTIDKPLLETEKFSMICSVGAFIPGWSLIVPKEHGFSMREYYNSRAFFEFFELVKDLVKKVYGINVIAFEHGANKNESLTACGTCHSHLHVVPFGESILAEIKADRDWIACDFKDIKNIVGDNEYLLYSDIAENIDDSTCYIHILKEETSQYFRKMLAKHIDYQKDYSYKTNLLLEETEQTVRSYREGL